MEERSHGAKFQGFFSYILLKQHFKQGYRSGVYKYLKSKVVRWNLLRQKKHLETNIQGITKVRRE